MGEDGRQDPGVSHLIHQLRTPLSVIAGYAELIATRDDERARTEGAARIHEAGGALSNLLSDVETLVTALLAQIDRGADNSRRILVADDDASIRALLRATLPEDEYSILEATNGREALVLAQLLRPDLLLLDWSMPELDGAAVLERLAPAGVTAPVIMLTAEHEPRYRRDAERLGVTTFLTKPFSPLELIGQVQQHLP